MKPFDDLLLHLKTLPSIKQHMLNCCVCVASVWVETLVACNLIDCRTLLQRLFWCPLTKNQLACIQMHVSILYTLQMWRSSRPSICSWGSLSQWRGSPTCGNSPLTSTCTTPSPWARFPLNVPGKHNQSRGLIVIAQKCTWLWEKYPSLQQRTHLSSMPDPMLNQLSKIPVPRLPLFWFIWGNLPCYVLCHLFCCFLCVPCPCLRFPLCSSWSCCWCLWWMGIKMEAKSHA